MKLVDLMILGAGAYALYYLSQNVTPPEEPPPDEPPTEPPVEPPIEPPVEPPAEQPVAIPFKTNWKVAFVVLEGGGNTVIPITDEHRAYIEELKAASRDYFLTATKGLGTIDTSYPTVVMRDLYSPPGTLQRLHELIPDEFHFIVILSTYTSGSAFKGTAGNIKNYSHGTGRPLHDNSAYYGGWAVLESAPYLPDFLTDMQKTSDASAYANWMRYYAHVTAHEIIHRWLVYWHYLDDDGVVKQDFAADPGNGGIHYSGSVSDCGGSPMGGQCLRDNGDGTFSAVSEVPSDFNVDLYMMGLIPKEQVNPVKVIVPTGASYWNSRNEWTIPGYVKYITVDQIIAVEGERWDADRVL